MGEFNYNQPYVVVSGIIEKDEKFLMVHEAHGPYKGLWNIPAGKLDIGESLVEGAVREVYEETGYKFKPEKIVGIYLRHNKDNSTLHIVFKGSYKETKNELKGDIDEVRWFSFKEVISMDEKTIRSEFTKRRIQDYLSGQEYSIDILKEFYG